uniref:Putative threonine aldolase n=1 Tax=Corethrella appendiculata TaxID=1370023 RepID=U5ERL8_9DIPT
MYSQVSNGNDVAELYRVVDLRSDTVSKPSEGMKRAMFEAEVGDDVYNEDPTVQVLEKRCAKLFGKEAAVFVPTGTMANLLAVMVHCDRRGTEAIVGDLAHIFLYEQGGAAQIAGVSLNQIKNKPDGTYCLDEMKKKFRGLDLHEPITSLVCVENTHNMCGGKVLPLNWLNELSQICHKNKIKVHMDGARIFNASEYLNIPVSKIVENIDSVCFCLSKGLTCGVGSVLIGTSEFIASARRLRKALGGGMRQVGFLAAAGLYALDEIVPKLKQDHAIIRRIAEAIHSLNSKIFRIDLENVHTNILMIHITTNKLTSGDLGARLKIITDKEMQDGVKDKHGKSIIVKASGRDWSFARLVCYNEITDDDCDAAITKILYVLKEYESLL